MLDLVHFPFSVLLRLAVQKRAAVLLKEGTKETRKERERTKARTRERERKRTAKDKEEERALEERSTVSSMHYSNKCSKSKREKASTAALLARKP